MSTSPPPDTAGEEAGPEPPLPMRRKPLIIAGATFVGLLALVVILTAVIPSFSESSGDDTQTAPDVSFATLDGGEAAIRDYRGEPLVLNFFASWCAPCIREMPEFEAVHQQYDGEVAFLGIAVSDRDADTDRLIEDTGVTYDIGRDPVGDLYSEFDGLAMPLTAFIAADGTVVTTHNGALDADDLTRMIEEDLLS